MLIKIKQWFKSWTINFALLLQIAVPIQVYLEQSGYAVATMIVSIIVIALRLKTTEAVHEK